MLQVGEKDDFLAGEEPLYCYNEVMDAFELRKDLKLILVEGSRADICESTHPVVTNYNPEKIRIRSPDDNVILWQFPLKVEMDKHKMGAIY